MLDNSKYQAIETAARERLKDERLGRFTAQEEARQAFRADLEREYIGDADVSPTKRNRLFELAWEEGHSCGYGEVENHYMDFVDLVLPDAE